jgi:transcriptional regulator with XRE-family HTH domain
MPRTASAPARAEPPAVVEARLALGRQLAALRRAAGHSQHSFAGLLLYGRSTLANVETGRQNVPREFWRRCDAVLGTGGRLEVGFGMLLDLRARALSADADAAAGRLRRAVAPGSWR